MEKGEVTGHSSGCVTAGVEEEGRSSDDELLGVEGRIQAGVCPERRACSIQVRWPTNWRDSARSPFAL
jgi:hypothetical protein